MKLSTIHKPAKTATSSQGTTTTPEVQQLVANLIQKGPDPPHTGGSVSTVSAGKLTPAMNTRKPKAAAGTGKLTATPSTGKPQVAVSIGKPTVMTSTKPAQPQQAAIKPVTTPDPSQVISIDDDDNPMPTPDMTATTAGVLDTAVVEEEELL